MLLVENLLRPRLHLLMTIFSNPTLDIGGSTGGGHSRGAPSNPCHPLLEDSPDASIAALKWSGKETARVVVHVDAASASSWDAVAWGSGGASHTEKKARRGLLDRAGPPSARDGRGTCSQLAVNSLAYVL